MERLTAELKVIPDLNMTETIQRISSETDGSLPNYKPPPPKGKPPHLRRKRPPQKKMSFCESLVSGPRDVSIIYPLSDSAKELVAS
jgi:hypothetical protein